ncbi:MAG TPA: extracellular solute-binding protein [Clostridiaceae bacterium]|nr:extracellular solute-binding protein [Clostridiaceae bacterium]
MKTRNIYKPAAFIAVLAVLFLFSGCNEGINENVPDYSGVDFKDPFGKYDPEIEVNMAAVLTDQIRKTALVGDITLEKNVWTDLIKEKLGIKIKYKWIANADEWITKKNDEYNQRLNIAMASGDLPDIMLVNPVQLKKLVDADMVVEMQDYWDEYASPFTSELYKAEGELPFKVMTVKGKLYGIPRLNDSYDGANCLIWYRKDWLEKLNLPEPKNMDELVEVIEAFSTQDPDGNGKRDTYGLGAIKDIVGAMGFNGIFNGYHAYPGIWVEGSTGSLVYGSIQPEVKTALREIRGLYEKGFIDKDFSIKGNDGIAEDISEGKIGMIFGPMSMALYPLQLNILKDAEADWGCMKYVSSDDRPVMVSGKLGTTDGYAVRKGFEYPEVLVKLINIFMEKVYGPDAEFRKYGIGEEQLGNGSRQLTFLLSPVTTYPSGKNMRSYELIKIALQTGDTSEMNSENLGQYDSVLRYMKGIREEWGVAKLFSPDGAYKLLTEIKSNGELLLDKFIGAPTETMAEKMGVLDDMQNEVFTRIIMGDQSLDSFDEFVRNWKMLGGDRITKEVNEWYSQNR